MKPKILTVDDSKTIRLIVTKAFKQFDVEVFEAANGVEGLAVAAREKPDVVILDITMPIMDGAECLAKLKANPELKNIPVVMLTAESGRENVLKIAKMGVRDYLVKPFKEDLIVERIGRIVELKTKGEGTVRAKRFDDPIALLIVDDKPAILDQIKSGLADVPWRVDGRTQTGEAVDYCSQQQPDAILVSLTLPDSAGFTLFQMFRASAKTKKTPIFGMCVKTAAEEQLRAQQVGFSGVITKPIDMEDLKSKVCRALNLDTSYKYFAQRDGVLVLSLPPSFSANVSNEIGTNLRPKVAEAVDSGLDKLIIDLSACRSADINMVKLVIAAMQLCSELALKQRIVGSPAVVQEFRNYEESKDWQFSATYEEALTEINNAAFAAAA